MIPFLPISLCLKRSDLAIKLPWYHIPLEVLTSVITQTMEARIH